jgi:hypothetical protein
MTCIPRPSPKPTLVWPEVCLAPGSSCYNYDDSCCGDAYSCIDEVCRTAKPTPTPLIPKALGEACTWWANCISRICSNGLCSSCSANGQRCQFVDPHFTGGTYIDEGDCCAGHFCYYGFCHPDGWVPLTDVDRQQLGSACDRDYSDTIGVCYCDNQRCGKYVNGVTLVNCVPAGGGPIGTEVSRCCSGMVSDGKCL